MPNPGERINPRAIFSCVWIPPVVFNDPDLSPTAKLCFGRLASMCGEKEYCWPSQDTLAEELGVTSRSVRECLSQLEERGFIGVEQVGLRKTNRYWMRWTQTLEDDFSDRKKTSGQERKKTSGLDRKKTSGPIGISSDELVHGNTPPPPSENSTRKISDGDTPSEIDFTSDAIALVQNMYSRLNRRAKLTNLRSRSSEPLCENIRRADKDWGRRDFSLALESFLADHSDWLVEKRWPIQAFLKQVQRYIPSADQDRAGAHSGRAASAAGPAEDAQRHPAAPDPATAPQIDFVARWKELVPLSPIIEWSPKRDGALLAAAVKDEEFVSRFDEICTKSRDLLQADAEGTWYLDFRWLLRSKEGTANWWRVVSEQLKPKPKSAKQKTEDFASRKLRELHERKAASNGPRTASPGTTADGVSGEFAGLPRHGTETR